MNKVFDIYLRYYRKKRRLNYIKVAKLLNQEGNGGTLGVHAAQIPDIDPEEIDSDSSDQDDDETAKDLPQVDMNVLPASLINSLYNHHKKSGSSKTRAKAEPANSANSSRELSMVLAQIFIGDCSSLDFSRSAQVGEEATKAVLNLSREKTIGMMALKDSILLKKKKTPNQIYICNENKAADKNASRPLNGEEGQKPQKHRTFEPSKVLDLIAKRNAENKAKTAHLQNRESVNSNKRLEMRMVQARAEKEFKQPPNLQIDDSAGKLKKSYQNLNINININFNERKKEVALNKFESQKKQEEPKKDYPKLNLFNLISKTKKTPEEPSIPLPLKSAFPEHKVISSTELVKVFKKKHSEPTTSQKVLFAKKNSEVQLVPATGSGYDSKEGILAEAEPEYKDSLFLKKKHSMSSSVNCMQQHTLNLHKSKTEAFNSAERTESASKKNIDIFDKKRKNSNLTNLHSVKSKKDLRSSMKSQKLTSHRHQNSATKLEPKSSRNNKPSQVARANSKKSIRKLFMSQDFKQGAQVLGVNLFDFKTQAHQPLKASLKYSLPNQGSTLANSQSSKVGMFAAKRSLASGSKEQLTDAVGNSTYRSKRSSSKNPLAGGGSDQDLLGRRKKKEAGALKFSAVNLNQANEPVLSLAKKKKSTENVSTLKHQRVRSDFKTTAKLR